MLKSQIQKIESITPEVMIVGIDVAKKKHWTRIFDYRGLELTKGFSFKNNIDGFNRLVGKLSEIKEERGLEKIIVGMEPTWHYWKALAWFLKEQGMTVVLVNPYHVKQVKELDDNTQTKNDAKDAMVIARLVKDGRFSYAYLPEGIYAELRVLSTMRQQIRAKLNSAKNALVSILDEYFPEFTEVFKNLDGKAAMHILYHYPFPQDVRELGVEGIVEEFKKATKRAVGQKRAEKLYEAAKRSVGVKEGLAAAKIKIRLCIEEIRFFKKQLEEVEREMAVRLQETGIGRYILSIPGIGIVTAAGILGEIGDPSRFESWKQIRKYAGLNLIEDSSGERKGKTRISKRGRAMLRNLLYQVAVVMVSKNKEIKALYTYLKTRRENPLEKKQALIVVAVKVIKIIFALVKKKEEYDGKKVLGIFREKQIQAA